MLADEYKALTGGEAGLFGKWHVGTNDADNNHIGLPQEWEELTAEPHPILAGFDRFEGTLVGDVDDYNDWLQVEWDVSTGDGLAWPRTTHATEATFDAAGSWIASRKGDWLAFVMLHAPHSPWTTDDLWDHCISKKGHPDLSSNCITNPTKKCTVEDPMVYQTQMECADWYMGEFFDYLESTGSLDDTLIFLLGDNGTPSSVAESVFADMGGGKATVHENGIRVPFVVADGYQYAYGTEPKKGAPLIENAGRYAALNVHAIDLYWTILHHAGATSKPTYPPGKKVGTEVDSERFDDCFGSSTDAFCDRSTVNWDYSEQYNPAAKRGAIRYGGDKLRVEYNSANTCLCAAFYANFSDPMETTEMTSTWSASKKDTLLDEFESLHDSTGSWADGVSWCTAKTSKGCP